MRLYYFFFKIGRSINYLKLSTNMDMALSVKNPFSSKTLLKYLWSSTYLLIFNAEFLYNTIHSNNIFAQTSYYSNRPSKCEVLTVISIYKEQRSTELDFTNN